MKRHKKLIEVSLPLDAINKASAREKSIRHGHPSTLHLWWARRPLAAARAVIFAQMVDDPSAYIDVLRGDAKLKRQAEARLKARRKLWDEARALADKAQGTSLNAPEPGPEPSLDEMLADLERERLFAIIEDLVKWENTTNEAVLARARDEIWQSWRRACAAKRQEIGDRSEEIGDRSEEIGDRSEEIGDRSEEIGDCSQALTLFDPEKLPAFHDPFAGGGALPLEAQRLGLESHASDLNPVAVLINKAMIEIPPKFAGQAPVNPENRKEWLENSDALSGTHSLAKGNGSGQGSVSASTTAAAGGDIRDAVTDHASSGIRSSEHCGGMDAGIREGEGAFPGNRPGLSRRDGNLPDTLRGDRLVSRGGDGKPAGEAGRGGQDADDIATQVPRQPLISNSYQLFPNSYQLFPNSYQLFPRTWKGATGLAEDVRYYGQWMRDEAERRIGHLYPKVEVTAEMARDPRNPRPDLEPYVGKALTVIAWLWARTVKSPNPAFADVEVPLASTFMLSTKKGKEAYVEPVIESRMEEVGNSGERIEVSGDASEAISYSLPPISSPGYRFRVKVGKPVDAAAVKNGTKLSRGAHFKCLMSDAPMTSDYIKAEGKAGRMGARLMAIVAEGNRGRVYLAPTPEHEAVARKAQPNWKPESALPDDPRNFWTVQYGLTTYGDLFTDRQLVALTTFSDLVTEARERIERDAIAAGLADDGKGLEQGGTGATAYAEAVGVYLAFAINKLADRGSTICGWDNTRDSLRNTFGRQALPMVWDFAEANSLSDSSGSYNNAVDQGSKVVAEYLPAIAKGASIQGDAQNQSVSATKVVSSDPPYYDNIGYADLSDFFYVWLRRALRPVFPDLFATMAVPKAEELVATPYRHGSKEKAETFFLNGMTQAMHRLAEQAHPGYPVTIYYAFKQSETKGDAGTTNTGWDTFLAAVIEAGFAISGTWPMRTELGNRMIGSGTNALASSIVLVCRPRPADIANATRREFLNALKSELPDALAKLQAANIAPVDLAQAAIGPGMAVFTRYAQVLDAEGKPLSVRAALALINQVLDEVLAEQEGDFDPDSRFALAWFEQHGFTEGEFGVADVLARAKGTAVDGVRDAGIIASGKGRVRILKPSELPADWDPASDKRLTVWEMVHQLIRVLEAGGETAAADLAAKLGVKAETARELCYRLYAVCERKGRANDAMAYNGLVQSWPEISRLALESAGLGLRQGDLALED